MIRFGYILILICLSKIGFGQGLCSNPPAGSVAGSFTLSANSICAGQSVTITDNSGGTGVKYVYVYFGETSGLDLISTPNKTNAYVNEGTYKILQYGKKNGQDMFACKTIVVRQDNKPEFSYTPCNNTTLQITIPANSPVNDFDYYDIDWGDTNPPQRVPKLTTTDFTRTRSLTFPRTIKVEGFYTSGVSCPSPSAITIPQQTGSSSGYNLPNYPNISKVEITTAQNAALTIKGSYEGSGYDLFMTERGQPYPATAKQSGVKPSTLNIALPDSNKSYCFYISKPIPCGMEISSEICTIVLNEVKPVNRTNEVRWASTYPIVMNLPSSTGYDTNPAFGRFMNSTTKLIKKENTTILPKIPASGIFYIDSPIDCAKKYCYRLETETSGQIFRYNFSGVSLSKEICIDRKSFNPPAITDASVSVLDNKIDISYTDNSGWTLNKKRFRLLRQDGGVFKSIDSTTVAGAKLKDTQSDPNQQSFCYKIGYLDECDSYSLLSPAFCSVFLKEDPANNLAWTSQSPFGLGTITNYNLIPYNETISSPLTPLAPIGLNLNPTTHTPDLSSFQEEARFSIQTTSSTGKVVSSNVISIPIKPVILVPEAFTPNGDSDNEVLKVYGTLRRVTDFRMTIFSRWGGEIFTTDNKTEFWNGKLNGKNAPPGIYFYQLYSKFSTGAEISKRGSVLLLR